MRISELASAADVPVGTIKYYLREGLLAGGHRTSRTTAVYDPSHVERLRLIRALVGTGGLDIAAVKRVVAVIDAPSPDRLDLLSTAQDALTGDADESDGAIADVPDAGRARSWVTARGWPSGAVDPVVERLERAWKACEDAGVPVDEAMMDAYADAVERVARVDVAAVPPQTEAAVHRVIVGTVMMEPILSALRLLAQRHVSVQQDGRHGPEGGAC